MRVEGGQTIAGTVEEVFAALLDADTLARAIPGCERLIQLGPPGAGGAGSGTRFGARGAVDLVPRDGHTAVAYAFDVDAITGAASVSAETCRQVAQTICERLSMGVRAAQAAESIITVAPLAEAEAVQVTTPRGRIVALPPLPPREAALAAPLWVRRALWMGAGALVGISAIAVMSAVVRRLVDRDG